MSERWLQVAWTSCDRGKTPQPEVPLGAFLAQLRQTVKPAGTAGREQGPDMVRYILSPASEKVCIWRTYVDVELLSSAGVYKQLICCVDMQEKICMQKHIQFYVR